MLLETSRGTRRPPLVAGTRCHYRALCLVSRRNSHEHAGTPVPRRRKRNLSATRAAGVWLPSLFCSVSYCLRATGRSRGVVYGITSSRETASELFRETAGVAVE